MIDTASGGDGGGLVDLIARLEKTYRRAVDDVNRAAGYAVVPVDATEAQTRAAAHLDWNAQIDPTWGEIYRVMIAAAEDT